MTGAPAETGSPARRNLTAPVAALAAALALGLGLLAGWAWFAPRHLGDDGVDAGFARDMSEHHAQAVQMSLLVMQRTEDPDVRRLATDIATTQANQQGMMSAWLGEWGLPMARAGERMTWMSGHDHDDMHLPDGVVMPGMASPEEISRLTDAQGQAAEILYLQLMTTHHIAGVEMAEAAVAGGSEPRLLSLAGAMVDAQRFEISLMHDLLADRDAATREDVSRFLPDNRASARDTTSPAPTGSPGPSTGQEGHDGH